MANEAGQEEGDDLGHSTAEATCEGDESQETLKARDAGAATGEVRGRSVVLL